MLAAYTTLQHAEKVKQFLIKKNLINQDYNIVKELGSIYFPILKKMKVPHAQVVSPKFAFPKKKSTITVEDLLKNKLTKKELLKLPRSQEVVGSIMILEVPNELHPKEKIIAESYLQLNKNIKTVVKKHAIHSGVYRTRKVKILAGKKTKETIHFENGIKVKLHLEKTYFSARSGNERLRIAKQIKKGEEVLVMFSGAGPLPLVMARNSNLKSIVGVEINPEAHIYAVQNVELNKFHNIVIHNGDVRLLLPKMRKKFDRIVMPLPKTSEEFLDVALPRVKKGGIIHLYAFLHETQILDYTKKVRRLCRNLGFPIRVVRKVKCGQFSPGTFRMCYDIRKL